MAEIAIIDYGMGNLRSVQKAFEHLGAKAEITADSEVILNSSRIVLPGVGAFRDAIHALENCALTGVIPDVIRMGKPFLGICLGLQLLFDRSYEDGEYTGLGIVPGTVQKFQLPADLKIPHMGWNQLNRKQPDNRLLQGIPDRAWFYFVHSYHVVPDDPSWIAATTEYGEPFVSVISKDNVFATQFHPEKSQSDGLHLLQNFVNL